MSIISQLRRVADEEFIEATLEDRLSPDDLFDVEAAWAPARVRLLQQLSRFRVPQEVWPESLHWDWAMKATRSCLVDDQFSDLRVFGIRAENEWQGILLATCVGHRTQQKPLDQEQVYIEYIETAPWNWGIAEIGQIARFKGVGYQLMEMACRWSIALGHNGRVACHALPQAETFYRERCGMTDLGEDPNYESLRYFELTEVQSRAFLRENQ